jgi:DNA invertase Pin-like site-specific DNA recombinase
MADLLGAVRLSDVTNETTSPERQERHIKDYAAFKRHNVIHIAHDVDVSGAISPFDREGLGPWLREPLLDRWSVLAVAKLDRLTRSILDFETLWKFLEAHDKTLVSFAEDMDFGTPTGRLMARQLVMFAEYEREMIRSRIKEAYDSLHQHGQYAGMQFPFGYVPVKLQSKGWGYDIHPVYGPTLKEVVDRLLAGESLGSLCRWLDGEGIPTPRNAVREYSNEMRQREGKPVKPLPAAHWKPTSLTKILRSAAIVGAVTANGKAMEDDKGLTVKRAEPIIDRDKWEQVKAMLDRNADRTGPRVNASPLLRVAYCAECGSPMYITRAKYGSKVYRYYTCIKANRDSKACSGRRVSADDLERWTAAHFLARVGDAPSMREVQIAGLDVSTEMSELAEAIGNLSARIALTKAKGADTTELEATRDEHERKLDELAKVKPTKARTITEYGKETYGELWKVGDTQARRKLLLDFGAKVYVAKGQEPKIEWPKPVLIADI